MAYQVSYCFYFEPYSFFLWVSSRLFIRVYRAYLGQCPKITINLVHQGHHLLGTFLWISALKFEHGCWIHNWKNLFFVSGLPVLLLRESSYILAHRGFFGIREKTFFREDDHFGYIYCTVCYCTVNMIGLRWNFDWKLPLDVFFQSFWFTSKHK